MNTENRPVLTGLVALVGVALVIGVLGGLGIMVAVKATGIGDSSDASDDSRPSATFRLPKPTRDQHTESPRRRRPSSPGTETLGGATPAEEISLAATQQSVSPMQQIDLTGTYPSRRGRDPAGAAVRERCVADFPVTMSVSGATFATYVQTSRVGPNKFRVVDTDTQKSRPTRSR